ncbi:MAG: GH92 family glycosyl hydrolase [Verrucomicrobiota bacterium]|jgi:predicted alpha-1,2-mannosidase
MKKFIVLEMLLACFYAVAGNVSETTGLDNARFVNPFIGTGSAGGPALCGPGHTYPGAIVPFGLVQVSPDTGNIGWNYCSGYRYEDSSIIGFSHTHLSGTGWMDLGDLRFMPFTGNVQQEDYRSRFSHADEKADPGYYSVQLPDYNVKVELTATEHCAYHRYTFATNTAQLLIDLRYGIVPTKEDLETHVIKSEIEFEGSNALSGYTITKGWAGEKHVYFVIQFGQPIAATTWLSPTNATRNQRLVLTFQDQTNVMLEAKVAVSTVDVDGAKNNLVTEIPGWNFESVKVAAYQEWNKWLAAIQIEGTPEQKEIFYTALYHTLVVPNNIADVDGRYRGADNKVCVSKTKTYYSTLSLWDTFRAKNPLYTILWPGVDRNMLETFLAHFDVQGYLPVWTLWGHENNCMIANHAIPIIADAYLRGICKDDAERAYTAMKTSSTVNHLKSDWDIYMRYGYYPSDLIKEEAVSRTLESAFDDWCVAQMAKMLDKKEDYALFTRRSQFYRNLFDKTTGLMRGRNSDGFWVSPFDPLTISHAGDVGGDYTEANAWQYTWHVQQDPYDLIRLMGGDQAFVAKLDKIFTMPSKVEGGVTVDITGLIGQYVHGNEPCHHDAYLYDYAGMPWKTQERVHQIVSLLYNNTPGGICGNDDCGQMSAWYIFSVLGFYPVNPASGIFAFGSPSLKKATMMLPNGKTFTVESMNNSPDNIYIERVEFNGKSWPYSYIRYKDIAEGGQLKIFMAATPNYEFGKSRSDRPPLE